MNRVLTCSSIPHMRESLSKVFMVVDADNFPSFDFHFCLCLSVSFLFPVSFCFPHFPSYKLSFKSGSPSIYPEEPNNQPAQTA